MDDKQTTEEIKKRLSDREYRLRNLYTIVDKDGVKARFCPNSEQMEFIREFWYNNIILKARQLGFSTLIEMIILDECLFNSNTHAGIIDWNLPDAKKKLEKCRLAYDHLPAFLKENIGLIKDNEQELKFSNGSWITADTGFRGDTLQILHISEHAKICKKDPIKAKEIKTGALNSVAIGQKIFIESTAEDGEGDFYDLCKSSEAIKQSGTELSKMDYKFFFFPWWKETKYKLTVPENYVFTIDIQNYFSKLSGEYNISVTDEQKYWYVKKKELLGEEIKREYPSTSSEAFEATTNDKYYAEIINTLKHRNQICEFDIDEAFLVDIAFDLGRSDFTSVGFFQQVGKEIRVVDFIEMNNVHISVIIGEIKKRGYRIGKVWLPHDAKAEVLSASKNIYQQVLESNITEYANVRIVEKLGVQFGINEVLRVLPNFWFRRSTTSLLADHLSKYSKKWSAQTGTYAGEKHDEHSHSADMIRYYCVAYRPEEISTDRDDFESRRRYRSEQNDEYLAINPLAGF